VYFAFANKATTTAGSNAAPNKATTAAGPTAAAGQATTTAGPTAAVGQATTTAAPTAAAGQATTTAAPTAAPIKATTTAVPTAAAGQATMAVGPTDAPGQATATFLPMTYVEDWDIKRYGCTDKYMRYYSDASSIAFERQTHQLMQDHCNSSEECKGYYHLRHALLSATHTPKTCTGPMKEGTQDAARFWKKGGPCTAERQAGVSTRPDRTPCSAPWDMKLEVSTG
jgi:hypothetical protein